MSAPTQTQYTVSVDLVDNSWFSRVEIDFTPLIRAGCEYDWRWSYIKFRFQKHGGGEHEESFLPVYRWTDTQYTQWKRITDSMPATFEIEAVFEKAIVDLVL